MANSESEGEHCIKATNRARRCTTGKESKALFKATAMGKRGPSHRHSRGHGVPRAAHRLSMLANWLYLRGK